MSRYASKHFSSQGKSEPEDILISLVIPVFNQEAEIGSFLESIYSYLAQQSFHAEIIVVDDASTDSTSEVLEKISSSQLVRILRNNINSGKGYSVKQGVMVSKGRFVLVMDGDGAYDISTMDHLLSPLLEDKCDVVLGSRRIEHSRFVLSPKYLPYVYIRHLLGQIFNFFTRITVLPKFNDTQCGYKCFSRKAAADIFSRQRVKGFCFDVEVLFLAIKLGYRCLEIPVTFYYHGEPSTVRLLPDSLYLLRDLVRIRLNDILGRYDA